MCNYGPGSTFGVAGVIEKPSPACEKASKIRREGANETRPRREQILLSRRSAKISLLRTPLAILLGSCVASRFLSVSFWQANSTSKANDIDSFVCFCIVSLLPPRLSFLLFFPSRLIDFLFQTKSCLRGSNDTRAGSFLLTKRREPQKTRRQHPKHHITTSPLSPIHNSYSSIHLCLHFPPSFAFVLIYFCVFPQPLRPRCFGAPRTLCHIIVCCLSRASLFASIPFLHSKPCWHICIFIPSSSFFSFIFPFPSTLLSSPTASLDSSCGCPLSFTLFLILLPLFPWQSASPLLSPNLFNIIHFLSCPFSYHFPINFARFIEGFPSSRRRCTA